MAAPDAFLLALWTVAGGYAAVMGVLAWRTARGARGHTPLGDDALPSVTVVVAARNEERDLPRCLAALSALDYPADRLRIVVADDHSTDGTRDVVRRFARVAVGAGPEDPAERAHVEYLRVPDPDGHVRGKALALHAAIVRDSSEVLLFTDADCAPPPGWARRLAEPFAEPDVGLVFGLTVIEAGDAVGPAAQSLDWTLLLAACGALSELGVPATGMGNNLAVRRSAYDATGGYPALPFSVTEDFTLFRSVADETDFVIRYRLSPETVVHTHPAESLGAAYEQRRRWARGGLGGGPAILAAYAVLFLTHAVPVAAVPLAPLHGLAALAVMSAANLALLGAVHRRTDGALPLRARAFGLSEAFRYVYMLTLPAVLAFRPGITWKGREL